MTREAYIALLQAHDWHYQAADDHATYLRGRMEHQVLLAASKTLDPEKTLWNSYAPSHYWE